MIINVCYMAEITAFALCLLFASIIFSQCGFLPKWLPNDYLKSPFTIHYKPALTAVRQYSVQFSSVPQSCPTICDPMNRSTPGFPVHHQLLEFTQTRAHQVSDAISSSVVPFSSCPQSPPASGSFPMSQLFAWGRQSIGVSASASQP